MWILKFNDCVYNKCMDVLASVCMPRKCSKNFSNIISTHIERGVPILVKQNNNTK